MSMPTDSSGCGVQPPEPPHPLVSMRALVAYPCPECGGTGARMTEGATRLIRSELCSECYGIRSIILGWASSYAMPGLRHIVRLDDDIQSIKTLCALTIPARDLLPPQGLVCGGCAQMPIGAGPT